MADLTNYIPENAIAYTSELLSNSRAQLKIVKGRRTKYGDYRTSQNGKGPIITVNKDLNQYSFLITLVHEIAHALVDLHVNKRTAPHGAQWKNTFKEIMSPLLTLQIFPEEILGVLTKHMVNPKASTVADINLFRILKNFDKNPNKTFLEQVEVGDQFYLNNGRSFIKGERRRKNFLCLDPKTNRKYLINPLAEVRTIE